MSCGQFSPDDTLLAFARDSELVYHERTDDYPNLVNTTISLPLKYGGILDMQFSPDGYTLGVVNEENNSISLYKVLTTKSSLLEIDEGELNEFHVSSNGKAYVGVSYSSQNDCIIVSVYDAKTLQLKARCKISGRLYSDFFPTRKSYFGHDDAWFVLHVVHEGQLQTVLIDPSSWKIEKTIIHGEEGDKRIFKMANAYGTFIKNKQKKVYIFDIRSSDVKARFDEIDVNYVPEVAFINLKGYIVAASKDGVQPNIEVHKYQ